MSYQYDLPVVMTTAGAVPTDPDTLRTQIVDAVTASDPDFTANLPASMVEDAVSTAVYAVAVSDQARVELINSLTPAGANEFILGQLGQVYGVRMGLPTNVSALVTFSGTVGYTISQGFLITDGSYVYQTQATVTIGSTGSSVPVLAIALAPSATVPAAGAINQTVTSVPSQYTVTVTNPAAGTPAATPETYQSYRGRTMAAGLAASVSTGRFIRTLVAQVPGVSPQLIGVQTGSPGIRVIVGGSGDEYAVANAILQSVSDPTLLVGSAVSSSRNVTASVSDYPDTYPVVYVTPPAQTVTLTATWNTSLASFSGGDTFQALAAPVLAQYVANLPIGAPINELEMTYIFQQAVAAQIDPNLITRLVFSVYINGTLTAPASGYASVFGDPEGYFTCSSTGVTVTQG